MIKLVVADRPSPMMPRSAGACRPHALQPIDPFRTSASSIKQGAILPVAMQNC